MVSSNTMIAPGPERGAEVLLHPVHVVGRVEVLVAADQPLERRAAGQEELEFLAVADAAREPEDEVAERAAELDFVVAGPLDVPGDRSDARARSTG